MTTKTTALSSQERLRAQAALAALNNSSLGEGLEGLPIRMRSQGMVTGLTLFAKRSPGLADAVAVYLSTKWGPAPAGLQGAKGLSAFVRAWCELGPDEAAQVEAEALAFAEALKMMAKATGERG
ncbi:MAG: hypothetical protein RL071_2837 [Pseudomonadota bacterium]|jgi:hypothetical protein